MPPSPQTKKPAANVKASKIQNDQFTTCKNEKMRVAKICTVLKEN